MLTLEHVLLLGVIALSEVRGLSPCWSLYFILFSLLSSFHYHYSLVLLLLCTTCHNYLVFVSGLKVSKCLI